MMSLPTAHWADDGLGALFCRVAPLGEVNLALALLVPDGGATPVQGTMIIANDENSGDAVVETVVDGALDCYQARLLLHACGHLTFGEAQCVQYLDASGMDAKFVFLCRDASGLQENFASQLRDISGLPISALADLMGVSRATFHKWLNGGGQHGANARRLINLVQAFRKLRGLQITNMRAFLETDTPVGRPFDLLKAGKIAMATKAAVQMAPREETASEQPRFPKLMQRVVSGDVPHRATDQKRTYRPLRTPHLTEEQMIALGTPAPSAPRYRRGRR